MILHVFYYSYSNNAQHLHWSIQIWTCWQEGRFAVEIDKSSTKLCFRFENSFSSLQGMNTVIVYIISSSENDILRCATEFQVLWIFVASAGKCIFIWVTYDNFHHANIIRNVRGIYKYVKNILC